MPLAVPAGITGHLMESMVLKSMVIGTKAARAVGT